MAPDSDWLTWSQAAELVGCPVPTIEHHARTGRIERRKVSGPFPSLKRSSVEEFASRWREEMARRERIWAVRDQRRAAKEAGRIRPPEPEGWIQAAEAAERLRFAHGDHIVWLAKQGRFEACKVGVRWWVREADIEAYDQERQQWVSWLAAAELAHCSHETIRRAVHAGKIERRDVPRTQPSLSRASVLAFAQSRATGRGSA
jgi:hypothetical protein